MLRDTSPSDRSLNRTEFVLLCLFSIALPLVEAPKNIFWALFLFLWIGRSAQTHNWGNLSRSWDALFAALITIPVIGVLVSSPYPHSWRELGDIVGYVSLGWMISRSRLSARQIVVLCVCLIVATLAGVVHGYWVLATDPKRIWLQLNSVGHVNHSALYGAGIACLSVVAAAAVWFVTAVRSQRNRTLSLVAALVMLAVMVSFGSRGALLAYLLSVVGFLIVFARIRKIRLWPIALMGLVVAAAALALDPKLIEKTELNIRTGRITSERAEAFNTTVEMWRQRPLTGVGPANFSAVSPEQVEAWIKERGGTYSRDRFLFSSHAHNVYFNTLAERGLLGIGVLLILGFSWMVALWRRRPSATTDLTGWLSWGAGWSGWFVVFAGGMFNTTLHHEHGMLAALGLGLLLALDARSKHGEPAHKPA
jgi:O-antigen ligase